MPKLYEIASQYDTLVNFDMETDGDIDAFLDLMDGVQDSFNEKAEAICKLIQSFKSEAEAFKSEKLRLEKKQSALESKASALKSYLEYNARMIMAKDEKRKVGLFTIGFKKNPEKLIVDDGASVPDEYMKKSVDVSRLKDAVKSGEVFPGVRLEQSESLTIK